MDVLKRIYIREETPHQERYLHVSQFPGHREALRMGIEGQESTLFDRSRVSRFVDRPDLSYPLPLIFASAEERALAARLTGTTPPPERWVALVRTHLMREVM